MTQPEPVVVIGAGPAGIGAGIALGERGLVLESCQNVGGLCRPIDLDGAIFDQGGHSFHTPHPVVRDLVFSSLEMYEQKRDARCYFRGDMIPYPFQANFERIRERKIATECALGLAAADGGAEAADFEELIERRFGVGIARHFLLPYNRKLWGPDLKQLATDWAGERVAAPAGTNQKFSPTGGKRMPLQADTLVAYPARGGFGEIVQALARRLTRLQMGTAVPRLDPAKRILITQEGRVMRWNRIISTMPIDKLLQCLPGVPSRLMTDISRLKRLSLALVMVVVDHPVKTSIQRVYCADPEIPFSKVVINHASSSYLRSLPRHGVMAELSYGHGKPIPSMNLKAAVVRGLRAMGILKPADEVRRVELIRVSYGYPVPTHDRGIIVGRVKDWLEERRIHTVGRFGEWAYINSDEAIYRGLSLGRTLADMD